MGPTKIDFTEGLGKHRLVDKILRCTFTPVESGYLLTGQEYIRADLKSLKLSGKE